MALKEFINLKNKISFDNIVIGSGAGGSTTAYELLKLNKEVIILEEGPNISKKKEKIGSSLSNLYKNNGATPIYSINGGPLIGYGQGSCVGGSTYVNAGYFSYTPEKVFENWVKSKKIEINYKEFKYFFKEIKSEINVNTEDITQKDNPSKILNQISKMKKMKIEKCERFSSGRIGFKKNSMNNTYHKKLFEKNIDIIFNCEVKKIKVFGNKAKSLIIRNKKDKKTYEIFFKNLFVSCGPISSPALLIKSNLIKFKKNQFNFEFHINFKILVKFKNKINFNLDKFYDPDRPVSLYFMREYEKEGSLLSSANSEMPYILATASHFNNEIKKDIYKNFSNYGMYIYQIKSNSIGQIKNFFNFPFVVYKYNPKDTLIIKNAIIRITNFFKNTDVEKIYFPIENSLPINNTRASIDLAENLNVKKLHLVSVHGMSSLRGGRDDNLLTNFDGGLKNFNNIYINDASILPGNTGESPQASIMAMVKKNMKKIKL